MLLLAAHLARAGDDPWSDVMLNEFNEPIVWPTMPVSYVVNAANTAGLDVDGAVYAVVSAASTWEWVQGSAVNLEFTGSSDTATAAHDNINVVYFTEDWPADSSLLALTTVWSESTGKAVGFDIRINARDHEWTVDPDADPDKNDLQNTLAHEFGHALGFGHLDDDHEATMYPSAPLGETAKRDLSEADAALAATVYPDGSTPEAADAEYEPMLAALCGTRPGSPLSVPTLLALAGLCVLRARRSEAA